VVGENPSHQKKGLRDILRKYLEKRTTDRKGGVEKGGWLSHLTYKKGGGSKVLTQAVVFTHLAANRRKKRHTCDK